jgi:hypothetical protein
MVLLSCICLALAPRRAGAEGETPVIVVNFPTQVPYPTQVPIPTHCATPPVWASPGSGCGVAAVTVGHDNGEGGLLMALLVVNIFGFGVLGVFSFVGNFVRRS